MYTELEASGMPEASGEVATALPVSEVTAAVESVEEAEAVEGVAELDVRVVVVEEGALVRWAPHVSGDRCAVRWFRDDQPRRLLALSHTTHDHLLGERSPFLKKYPAISFLNLNP